MSVLPRVVAIVATFNERRFIGGFIAHCASQGVDVYVIDNESTDDTVEIASAHEGRGLVGLEVLPRHGVFDLTAQLRRKSAVAESLDADWFIHADADERRLPPDSSTTIAAALADVARAGCNAVNFIEFAFVPTLEQPDHDHADFERTMRSYYAHVPVMPHRLNAWHATVEPVDLATGAGHQVWFEGINPWTESWPMRHYLYLSREHAVEKYVGRGYAQAELNLGWHQARAELRPSDVVLQSASDLKTYIDDDHLDAADSLTAHPLFAQVQSRIFDN